MGSLSGRRRRIGVFIMIAGAAVGIIGRAGGGRNFEITAGALALVLFLGGAMVIADTYRAEFGRPLRGSRGSLLAHQATSSLRNIASLNGHSDSEDAVQASGSPAAPATATDAAAGEAELRVYAARFEVAIERCQRLLDSEPGEVLRDDLEQAREALMVLVANQRYGPALAQGLIEESTVRQVSARLAERLA